VTADEEFVAGLESKDFTPLDGSLFLAFCDEKIPFVSTFNTDFWCFDLRVRLATATFSSGEDGKEQDFSLVSRGPATKLPVLTTSKKSSSFLSLDCVPDST